MSKKIISLLLCLCMVLSSVIITGAADFDETEIKEESVPAAETPAPAEEAPAPAEAQEELPAQAPEAAGQETGEQPAQESKIPAGFKEQLLEVCVDDRVVVQVGGYMPKGARLEVEPLSDEAMASSVLSPRPPRARARSTLPTTSSSPSARARQGPSIPPRTSVFR